MDSNYEPFPNKTIRDWVLGIGEFSEENLRKSRQETAKRMVATVMESMERHLDKVFSLDTNHDAVPAAKASEPESSVPLGSGDALASTQEPVAWAVRKHRAPVGESPVIVWCASEVEYAEIENRPCDVIPLYRQPQPTLTDAEREAIEGAMWDYGQYADEIGLSVAEVKERQDALRSLLERTK